MHETALHRSPHEPPASRRKGERLPVVWHNLVNGKYHAVNNDTGEHVPCDSLGHPLPTFHIGVSGIAKTQTRVSMNLTDTSLQKSLQKPAPERPAPIKPNYEERVSSKNLFGVKIPTEAELFLQQQKILRLQYPEREARAQEEEAKARYKLEELHKRYYALQASMNAGKLSAPKEQKSPAKLSKSQSYTFSETGVYRP